MDKGSKKEKSSVNMILLNILISFIIVTSMIILTQMKIIPWEKIIPTYRIPQITGIDIEKAETVCISNGIQFTITEEVYSDDYKKGEVVSQSPAPFTIVRVPKVAVTVSRGVPAIHVPDLTGLTKDEAEKLLNTLSLNIGAITFENTKMPKDTIIASDPVAGEKIEESTTINITISKGEGLVSVPKLVGKSIAEVQRILASTGLTLGYIKKTTDIERIFGIIIKQHPPYRKDVPKGTPITVILNEEEE